MLGQDMKKRHPEGGVATGMTIFERTCKPGAIVKAVIYRATKIEMLRSVALEVREPLLREKLDAVFRAVAEIPMEWIGVGIVHHGWAFDVDDLMCRVGDASESASL
jgi:hypothetical protein